MNDGDFETFDFLINEEDEVMLLLYARDGEPGKASVELDKDEGIAVLNRGNDDVIMLKDISAEVFDSLEDADNLLVCELSKDEDSSKTKIIYAYEAEISD